MSGKSQGIFKWTISGNPEVGVALASYTLSHDF